MHRFEMSSKFSTDDRERYLRKMSDRLHDRFLEKPAFLDLEFIRREIKKLDSRIDEFLASDQTWPMVRDRLGDPVEYADAVFASRLLSGTREGRAGGSSVMWTVLKILFVIAPVNFLVAIGPLLLGGSLLLVGWLIGLVAAVAPVLVFIFFVLNSFGSVGVAEVALLFSLLAFGQLLALAMVALSRLFFSVVWSWLNWNVKFLRAESSP